jgi:acetyl-CoA carboxylase carboxyl transferase subunit beta
MSLLDIRGPGAIGSTRRKEIGNRKIGNGHSEAMRTVAAVGAVIGDGQGRVLLVLRRFPPEAGCWSVPGGRIEPGESPGDAVAREVLEETGLRVQVGATLGELRIPGPDADTVYDIHDLAATVIGGGLRAGDDAADVRWVGRSELAGLPVTDGLAGHLERYGAFD